MWKIILEECLIQWLIFGPLIVAEMAAQWALHRKAERDRVLTELAAEARAEESQRRAEERAEESARMMLELEHQKDRALAEYEAELRDEEGD